MYYIYMCVCWELSTFSMAFPARTVAAVSPSASENKKKHSAPQEA